MKTMTPRRQAPRHRAEYGEEVNASRAGQPDPSRPMTSHPAVTTRRATMTTTWTSG